MRYRQRFIKPRPGHYSQNRILAKKTALQLLAIAGSLFLLLLKIIGGFLLLAGLGTRFFFRALTKLALLPAYRLAKMIAVKLAAYKAYWQNQFGENFARNVVIYGGLSWLALFATATNLKARELRPEEIGRQSGLYTLLIAESDAEIEIVEEGAGSAGHANSSANQGLASVGVQSQNSFLGSEREDSEGLSTLAQSGDALLKPDLTGTEITPERRDKIITYTVEADDTISEIADKFDVSTNTILWENKLGPRDFIKPGQQLAILPVTGLSHTVKRGDTLDKIAASYRAKSEDILEVNKLADGSALRVGEKIVVPDGIPPVTARPSAPAISRPSGLANLGNIFKSAPAASGNLNWPTISRRISQYFRGWRHTGIDVPAPAGQPIYAADDGVVITAGWSRGGYGIYVIVDHGNGLQTLYGHNSRNLVERGDRVARGQVIANIGSTGRSTGPHVHFEIRVEGDKVNPLDYL